MSVRLSHMVALVVAGLGLIGALMAGWWGLGTTRDSHDEQPSGWIGVGNGWVRVDEVIDRSLAHRRMPNMQTMPDADPVPDGHVRYLVLLSVAAEDGAVHVRPGDLRVSASGSWSAPPHDVDLGDGLVPKGSTVSGSLTLDVPEAARELVLAFGDTRIPLAVGSDDDHPGPRGPTGDLH